MSLAIHMVMKYNCRYTYWPPRISLQTWLTSKSRKTRQALQYSSNIIIFWWNERSSDVDLAYFPSSGFPHFRYWQIPNYFPTFQVLLIYIHFTAKTTVPMIFLKKKSQLFHFSKMSQLFPGNYFPLGHFLWVPYHFAH